MFINRPTFFHICVYYIGGELTVDDRSWMMHMIPSMTVEEVTNFLYPHVYPLTDLNLEPSTEPAPLPVQMRASIDYFCTNEAYLIENGLVAFIWVGLEVPMEWVQAVFNANSVAQLDSERVFSVI